MDVEIRPLLEEDITETYVSWFSDGTVTKFLEARSLTRSECVAYLTEGQETACRYMYAICDPNNGQVIGTAKIGEIDRKSMVSDLVTLIGDRRYWGKGLATKAIRKTSQIAFERHGIRKLHGGMYEHNIGSIKAYLKAGWVIEAVLHGHYVLNGQTMDRVAVSCFNPAVFPNRPLMPSTRFDWIADQADFDLNGAATTADASAGTVDG